MKQLLGDSEIDLNMLCFKKENLTVPSTKDQKRLNEKYTDLAKMTSRGAELDNVT